MTDEGRKRAEEIIAYEWHNNDTGHCYVDYVAHNLMDENNGYVKTPLYKREEILHIIGHDFCKIIDKEVAIRIAEWMPTKEEDARLINEVFEYFEKNYLSPNINWQKMAAKEVLRVFRSRMEEKK
jgi:hypothetical protein